MIESLHMLISDYTLRSVALGAGVLGLLSGAMGAFALLRKQSLMGDTVSHAALPGIALAFMLTGSRSSLILMLGAALAGWLGTMFVMVVIRNTRIKEDTAMGLVLAVFFGAGLVLLTFVQRQESANQAGLDKYLFGQAAALVMADIVAMVVITLVILSVVVILWKEFKLISFDVGFAASFGLPVRMLEVMLTALIVTAIVMGLQTVGVVLMSALLVAPAAAARQWTDRLFVMVLLSALFGAASGLTGAVISSLGQNIPTGPMIVLSATAFALLSLAFAPNRGVIPAWLRTQRNKHHLQTDRVLLDLAHLAAQHDSLRHGHSESVLRAMSVMPSSVSASLKALSIRRLVERSNDGTWSLTGKGTAAANLLAESLEEVVI
jgi:manganese/zinc/iron transport system permease protein